MPRPLSDRPVSLLEALFATLCVGSCVLAAEIVQVAGVRLIHLSGLRFDLALLRVWGVYALVFGAVGAAGWLVTLPLRRLSSGRSGTFLFLVAACALPSLVFPVLLPTGGKQAGRFLGLTTTSCGLGLAVCWLVAALLSTRRGAGLRRGWVGLLFSSLPFVASAVVLAASFAVRHVEGRPLVLDGLSFTILQCVVVAGGAVLVSRLFLRSSRGPSGPAWLRAYLVVAAALLAMVAGSSLWMPRPRPLKAGEVSALVIVVDTLRADALAVYGGPAEDTPHLSRFREDAVLFERCISTAPWTVPSFASMFTSTYPSEHLAGARFADERRLDRLSAETTTIAETLNDAGFTTAASLTNSNLDRVPDLARGFERYSNGYSVHSYHPTAAWFAFKVREMQDWYPVAAVQTNWIRDEVGLACRNPRPFFVLGHYTDPHHPYVAPRRFYPPALEGQASVREHYRAEVRQVDAGIGALLDELRARGLYDDLLIVVTSDHGEELDELRRGRRNVPSGGIHGHTLFQEQLHVPLLIKLPGNRDAGATRDERVSLLDLAPTVVSALGVEVPAAFRGWNLFDESNADRYADRLLLAEALMRLDEQKAGFLGDLKVVVPTIPPEDSKARLFQLSADPSERLPADLEDGGAREIYDAILAHMRFWRGRFDGDDDAVELDPALLRHLEALGYTE